MHHRYEFAEQYHIPYQPWCAVALFWTALMCMLLASVNVCKFIHSFTRFSGELFGFLIAILFLQQGIKGLTEEYVNNRYGATSPVQYIYYLYGPRPSHGRVALAPHQCPPPTLLSGNGT